MNNANEIKFRCSSLGYIMIDGGKSNLEKYDEACVKLDKLKLEYDEIKNKATKTAEKKQLSVYNTQKQVEELFVIKDEFELSETAKTHCIDVFVSNKYNRFTEIRAKQLDKGNEVEEDSITIVSRMTKLMLRKNEERLENDWIQGCPDIYIGQEVRTAEIIRDTKSAWDLYSFYRSKFKKLKDLYYWQVQGYMDLTGARKGFVDHCLTNTPYHLVEGELRRESYGHPEGATPNWIELQIIANHTYDKETFFQYVNQRGINAYDEYSNAVIQGFVDIPVEERHHFFEFERDQDDIEKMHQRVVECRQYMNKHLFEITY